MTNIVIVSAKRTPIGKFLKSLSSLSAVDLGTVVSKAVMQAVNLDPKLVDQVIFGNVLQAGSGQNVARQIELKAGIPNTSTAYTVNQVCGSGMRAVRNGMQSLMSGDAKVVLVGGSESMSNAPFLANKIRQTHKFGDLKLTDDLNRDALYDAFSNQPMGVTAENVANKYQVSRLDQDKFALASQRHADYAEKHGYFKNEMVPVTIKTRHGEDVVKQDECIRPTTDLKQLSNLKSVFKKNGTVTAGNASALSDGASAMILMTTDTAKKMHLKPLAAITGFAEAGFDPKYMGYAPYYSTEKLLSKQGKTIQDYDCFELNEAFAAQSVAVARDLKIPFDKLNVCGGAIAMGHPLGDSGSRILITLINNLKRAHLHHGLATLCIGGGMGMTMTIKC